MTPLLSSEALKLRTIRLFWIVIAVTVLLWARSALRIEDLRRHRRSLVPASVAAAPAQASWFLCIVLAVVTSVGSSRTEPFARRCLRPRASRALVAKSLVSIRLRRAARCSRSSHSCYRCVGDNVVLGESFAGGGDASWWHVLGTVAVGAVWSTMAVISKSSPAPSPSRSPPCCSGASWGKACYRSSSVATRSSGGCRPASRTPSSASGHPRSRHGRRTRAGRLHRRGLRSRRLLFLRRDPT